MGNIETRTTKLDCPITPFQILNMLHNIFSVHFTIVQLSLYLTITNKSSNTDLYNISNGKLIDNKKRIILP